MARRKTTMQALLEGGMATKDTAKDASKKASNKQKQLKETQAELADVAAELAKTKRSLQAEKNKGVKKDTALATSAEMALDTGMQVVHTIEYQGAALVVSLADGYFGPDKMEVAGIDLRVAAGVPLLAYGLYDGLTNGGEGYGKHAMALGNGMLASYVAVKAVEAGRALADKQEALADPLPQPATAVLNQNGQVVMTQPAPVAFKGQPQVAISAPTNPLNALMVSPAASQPTVAGPAKAHERRDDRQDDRQDDRRNRRRSAIRVVRDG